MIFLVRDWSCFDHWNSWECAMDGWCAVAQDMIPIAIVYQSRILFCLKKLEIAG